MSWNPAFAGLDCLACGERHPPDGAAERCPACDGLLTVALEVTPDDVPDEDNGIGLWRFGPVLPVTRSQAVDLRPGGTPLVQAPGVADELPVAQLFVKEEGRNPTGSIFDRGMAICGGALTHAGVTEIGLASPGWSGQAASTMAARAGMERAVFVPSRSSFAAKALINVAGGEMRVIPGQFADAVAAWRDATADASWHPIDPAVNPYLRRGLATVYWELLAACQWTLPEVVVVPTGSGATLTAVIEAAIAAKRMDWAADTPTVIAAQPAGCAPIVDAYEQESDTPVPVQHPDTICGELEIPEPPAGRLALRRLRAIDGSAVAVTDQEAFAGAIALARRDGIIPSIAGGVATAALSNVGDLPHDATAVVINPGDGLTQADRLRSYLMSQGE